MNNFNPMFNTINMTRSVSPFATAGSTFANAASRSTGLFSKIGGSKITLSGILNGAQKTIGTVNQIVPLYNQIKPMFQNSKVLVNVMRGIRGESSNNKRGLFTSRRANSFNTTPIRKDEEKIIEVKEEKKQEEISPNSPSKPFFA